MFEEEKEEDPSPEDENPENEEIEEPENQEPDETEEHYQKELDEEKKRREKAESSAQYHREEAEKLRKERENFATKDELKNVEANLLRKTSRAQVEEEVRRIARNPKEAELILYHYDHSLVPTGSIATDVSRAHILANEKRLKAENEELEEALKSKEKRTPGVRGGTRMEDEAKEPELDPDTKSLVKMNKMTWDAKLKKFKNERGVTYDPKTGVTQDPRRPK